MAQLPVISRQLCFFVCGAFAIPAPKYPSELIKPKKFFCEKQTGKIQGTRREGNIGERI